MSQLGLLHLTACFHFTSRERTSLTQLEDILVNLAMRHPLLRVRIAGDASQNIPCFELMDAVRLDIKEVSATDMTQMDESLYKPSFDVTKGPLWCAKFIPNLGTHHINGAKTHQFTLILVFNHAICDAIAIRQFLKEIVTNLTDSLRGVDKVYNPLPFPICTEDVMDVEGQHTFLYKLCRFFARSFPMLLPLEKTPRNIWIEQFGTEISRNPTITPKTNILSLVLNKKDTMQLMRACKSHGLSPMAAIQAAVMITMARTLNAPATQLYFSVSVSLKRILAKSAADIINEQMVFHSTSVSCEVVTPDDLVNPDFWDVAQSCKNSTHADLTHRAKNRISNVSFTRKTSANLFHPSVRSREVAFFNNFGDISDINESDDPLFKLKSCKVYLNAEVGPFPLFTFNMFTLEEELCVDLHYYNNIVNKTKASGFFKNMQSVLLTEMAKWFNSL